MSQLHKQNLFTQPNPDNSPYPIKSIFVFLTKGNKKRYMVLEVENTEFMLKLLEPAGAKRHENPNEITQIGISDEDGSVNNIVKALLILKAKKMISPELLHQIYNGFPDYSSPVEPDSRIRAGVENKEVAYIRKAARFLALGHRDVQSPISQLPQEVCLRIAELFDDRGLLDELSAKKIACEFFKAPEEKDNSRAVSNPGFHSDNPFLAFARLRVNGKSALLAQVHENYGPGK